MKQKNFFIRILVVLALAIFATGALRAQAVIQVGTGTTPAAYFLENYAYNVYSQNIYTADLLPSSMEITEIAWEYVGSRATGKRMKIWLSTTTEDDINGKFVTSETNRQVVFEGVLHRVPPSGGAASVWLPIVLQTPYVYNGGNLVISASFTDSDWASSEANFRVTPSTNGKHVATLCYGDINSSVFLEGSFGTMRSGAVFTNIKLTYQVNDAPILSISPNALDFGEQLTNTTETQTVTASNTGIGSLTLSGVNISDPAFSCNTAFPIVLNAGDSEEITFAFSPETQNNYSATVEFSIVETEYYGSNTITLQGEALNFVPTTTIVGTGTEDANYLIHQGAYRTYTQTIYTADLLPPVMDILEIAYEYVGSDARPKRIKVWFSTTNEDDIAGKYVAAENNKEMVFEGVINRTPAGGGSVWLPLTLIEPYFYSGGNLVITTSVCDASWGQPTNFRVTPSSNGNSVTSFWWEDGDLNNFLENVAGVRGSFTNYLNVKFRYQSADGAILSIIPKTLSFPEQLINTTETQTVTIANIGTDIITVSGITISDSNIFSCDATFPIMITAGTSQQMTFSFTPDIQGDYSATAEFIIEEDGVYGGNLITLKGKARDFEPVDTRCWVEIEYAGLGVTANSGPHSGHRYVANQYIVYKDEIGTDIEGRIRRIGWHATGTAFGDNVIAVYLKNTDLEEFPLSGAIFTNASEMTKVYEGPYLFSEAGWNYIDIEPFLYDGTSNVLVTTVQLETSTANITNFNCVVGRYRFPMWYNCHSALTISSTSQPIDPYNPPVFPTSGIYSTLGHHNPPEICFVFDEVPQQPYITTSKKFLDYDEQEMNTINTLPVTVKNFGYDDMVITNIAFTSEDFYVTDVTFPIVIPFAEELTINFAVTPLQLGALTGKATFEFETPTLGNPHIDLSVFGLRFKALREGFEKELFPPIGWKVVDANNDGKTWARYKRTIGQPWHFQVVPHEGSAIASADQDAGNPGTDPVHNDWLITPKMKYATGDKFSFYLAGGLSFDITRFYVKLSRTSNNIADFTQTLEFIQPTSVFYRLYEYDLGDLGLKDGDEFYIGFQDFSYWTSRYPQIDQIRGPAKVMHDHDLMVQEFKVSATTHGAAIYRVGVAQNYTAIIANGGVNSVAGSEYTVELCYYDNNYNVVVLHSIPGQNLAREDYYTASINYAFTQTGKFNAFIRVSYIADENLENNISNRIKLDILPENVEFITSGTIDPDPGALYRWMVPVYFNTAGLMGSLSQTYHPKSHFNGVAGIITRYAYYIEHPITRANKDIKVYMANSNLPAFDVPGSYPNANEMDLVFDGRLTFPKANKPYEMFEIELQKPFFYTGENLIVMVEYQGGTGADGDPAFTAVVNQEPRIIYKMTQPFNVNNINGSGLQLMNMAPVTSFWIEKADGFGTLSGKVVYHDGTTPISGAKVAVTSASYPNLSAVAHTDATGEFLFPKIIAANDLKVTISHLECNDYVHNNVVLNVGNHLILPLTIMEPRPKVAISGRVICNAELPVSGVKVAFSGLVNYEMFTGADGTFTIPNMWGGTTYRLELERSGYQKNYFGDVAVLAANINLGDITILQTPYPVHALTATEQTNGSAQLSWYGPFDPHPKIFRRDNGTQWASVMADNPNPNLALGPAFHDLATIQKVMWYQATEMGIPQTTSSNIFLYGLLPSGQPNVNNLLGSYMNIPTIPNQWNEFVLPAEIEATNGFAVGIASAHTRLVLAFDNGVDPNWPWIPNTQWVLAAGSYSSPLESAIGLGVNLLIRAEGIWRGYFNIVTGKSGEEITQSEILEKQNTSGLSVVQNVELPSLELQPSNRLVLVDESTSWTPDFEFEAPHLSDDYFSTKSPSPQTGYDIYRANLPGAFVKINSSLVTTPSYNDATFASFGRGEFQYAVKTIYMNGVESGFVYSNVLVKDMYVALTINVTHNATGFDNTILSGASVSLVSNSRHYTGTLDATGVISSDEFYRGVYTLTINAAGFEPYTQTIDFTTSSVVYNINVVLIEEIIKPYVLEVKVDPVTLNEADFTWNPPPFFDGAENHEDFAIDNIENWTMRNLTGQAVAYALNSTWPNAGLPQAFTVFNPSATTPPIAVAPAVPGRDWKAYEGAKYFLSFVSYGPYGTTDSWMISKEFNFDAPFEVSFYVNALRSTEPYRVLFSRGSDQVGHFTAVGGTRRANPSNTTWQKVTVQMPAEAKRVAFQHYYENADLGLMIDNITIGIPKQQTHTFKHYEVFLDGEYVGQSATTDFRFTQLRNGV
ncbi:MAG: choice-of-anchor J domain-containing protein, partial [Lentimicrobiaceae bacterium]|nr:choice-of-anchor J domain-containing protein [Lentimicrobiaceae bacterium]